MRRLKRVIRAAYGYLREPRHVRGAIKRDHQGLQLDDPGPEAVIDAGLEWLIRAQRCSATRDGGVARHYHLRNGWGSSYPETTGYIIPTMLEGQRLFPDRQYLRRSKEMLEWLRSIQFDSGAFQGGVVDQLPRVPVTFNTGQILLGLAAGTGEFGEPYASSAAAAADWLVQTQVESGAWPSNPSPFAHPGVKVYDTHVAWGLLEAARVLPRAQAYGEAALKNVEWALSHQNSVGWFAQCDLQDNTRPLTHTLGYALRGVIEAARFTGEDTLWSSASRTAAGLLTALGDDGYLPGRLTEEWKPAVSWSCLTGTSQIAHCWILLYNATGESRYLDGAQRANRFVRRTISLGGGPDVRGGVKGSFPVDGGYGPLQILNWATKFTIDANLAEVRV